MQLEILYEDNHLLCITKPIGISTQPDQNGSINLFFELKKYLKKTKNCTNPYLAIIHRLDRNTGGVLIFAKTSKAAKRLSEQFKKRLIEKKYIAYTSTIPTIGPRGVMENYLIKIESKRIAVLASNNHAKAKLAKLRYELLETLTYNQKLYYKFLVIPETGRFHQIRFQFAVHKAPLLGDRKYGNDKTTKYPALWAYEIDCIHPTTKQKIKLKSEPPFDWPFSSKKN